MQILLCKGSLSELPGQPARVDEIIATSYQVLKELRVTSPHNVTTTSLYFSGLAKWTKLQFGGKKGRRDAR